jgi:hypothetical protein
MISEKRCLVYSIAWPDKSNIKKSHIFYMLQHSLRELRKHSNIDVVIYSDCLEVKEHLVEFNDLHFVEFDTSPYELEGDIWKFSKRVLHKWPNCIDLLSGDQYDRLMFCDADIHFYKDPNLAFDMYSSSSKIYIREERSRKIDGFNDGNFILGKEVARLFTKESYLEKYVPARLKLIADHLSEFSKKEHGYPYLQFYQPFF